MQKHNTKPGTPSFVPSKFIIINWLRSLFPDISNSIRIQDFGDGVIYCRLLNHYFGNPHQSKITWSPKNQYQYCNNLKHVQSVLLQVGIPITFDLNRISKRKFLENWALINSFYRHFNSTQDTGLNQQNLINNNIPSQHISNSQNNYNVPSSSSTHSSQFFTNSRFIQGTPLRLNSTNINELEHRPTLKQLQPNNLNIQNSCTNLGGNNTQQQILRDQRQRNQFQFTNLARNSLQISQYLKQNTNIQNTSPPKGKRSAGSQMFQNNHNAVVDRVKQILLKNFHDIEKVRQIKMLLGMPVQDEEVIKIEDDLVDGPIVYNQAAQKTSKPQNLKLQQIQKKTTKQEQKNLSSQKQPYLTTNQQKNSACKIPKKPFKV